MHVLRPTHQHACARVSIRVRTRQAGFTYLMLLWWVALSGLMLAAMAQSWVLDARRAREAELVWRGEQFRQAIEAYASVPVGEGQSQLPRRLEDLLEDRRSGELQRHLKRIWPDPITGRPEWGLVREGDGITGVHSLSAARPLNAPEGVLRYEQWTFVLGQPQAMRP
ncbi:MAG: type II secretion system GspH family protein [Gammaproteobacteria bacterium]|nr:type II secretion system GspH family protein [Gammaproteobacteria bacterium]